MLCQTHRDKGEEKYQSPIIDGDVVALIENDFRGKVVWGAAHGPSFTILNLFGKPQVDNLDKTLQRKE
jgi:hypothetical protein